MKPSHKTDNYWIYHIHWEVEHYQNHWSSCHFSSPSDCIQETTLLKFVLIYFLALIRVCMCPSAVFSCLLVFKLCRNSISYMFLLDVFFIQYGIFKIHPFSLRIFTACVIFLLVNSVFLPGTFVLFSVLIFTNSAAMNTVVYVFWHTYIKISPGHVPGNVAPVL